MSNEPHRDEAVQAQMKQLLDDAKEKPDLIANLLRAQLYGVALCNLRRTLRAQEQAHQHETVQSEDNV